MKRSNDPNQLTLPNVPAAAVGQPFIRNRQVERQWRLLIRLAEWRRGATLQSLREAAAALGENPVSERTIRRDVEALIGAGFQIVHGRDDGGPFLRLLDLDTVTRLQARSRAPAAAAIAGPEPTPQADIEARGGAR